jgi:hypothetical protein
MDGCRRQDVGASIDTPKSAAERIVSPAKTPRPPAKVRMSGETPISMEK